MSSNIPTTCHRDGTVTIWDIYDQGWTRVPADAVPHRLLATLTKTERRRISRLAARKRQSSVSRGGHVER